jgi:hypothetical protein
MSRNEMNAFSMSDLSETDPSRTSTIRTGAGALPAVEAVLFDLLMAVLNSLSIWRVAAHDTADLSGGRHPVTLRTGSDPFRAGL